jgi:transposase InsO family protein
MSYLSKENKQALRQRPSVSRNPGLQPFQSIQVDYTEMPKVGHLKYLLVIVDHLTHWVEAIPLLGATATNASMVLPENIIPRFGVIENTDSDNGSHFTANILKGLMKALEIKWEYHAPWHPPSSGRVERINQTLKKQLTKLVLET